MIKFEDIHLFKGVNPKMLKALEAKARLSSFDKGQILFRKEDACKSIYFIQSGAVKVYNLSTSGREQILHQMGPGESCACHAGCGAQTCSSSAEAIEDTKAWRIWTRDYTAFIAANPNCLGQLCDSFAERIRSYSTLIDDLSLKDTRQRLIRFLLDMTHAGDGDLVSHADLSLEFTREEIAQRLGTTRETVARNLSQLKKEGFIEVKPRFIRILDVEGLRNIDPS